MDNPISALAQGDVSSLRKYRVYRTMIRDYSQSGVDPIAAWKIHRRGFTVNDWQLLGLGEDNYKRYLTSKQYSFLHPMNGTYSSWIDDKLTLKYLCAGTPAGEYFPDYYFLLEGEKPLRLPDYRAPHGGPEASFADVANLLEVEGALAIKRIKGSIGEGFYKAEFDGSSYLLNGERHTKENFVSKVSELSSYLVTEYLRPHSELAKIYPNTPNTFRYLACRVDGVLVLLKSFIRFGCSKTGFVENFNSGGVLCYIDDSGHYDGGYVISRDGGLHCEKVTIHPDSGAQLVGRIPLWDRVVEAVTRLDLLFPQLEYAGIDFVVTDRDEVKILEINSLTSLDAIQIDCSLLDTEVGRAFFLPRLERAGLI